MYLWMVSLSLSRYQSVDDDSRSDLEIIHSLWPRRTGSVGTTCPGHVTVLIACERTPRRTECDTTHRDFRVVIASMSRLDSADTTDDHRYYTL